MLNCRVLLWKKGDGGLMILKPLMNVKTRIFFLQCKALRPYRSSRRREITLNMSPRSYTSRWASCFIVPPHVWMLTYTMLEIFKIVASISIYKLHGIHEPLTSRSAAIDEDFIDLTTSSFAKGIAILLNVWPGSGSCLERRNGLWFQQILQHADITEWKQVYSTVGMSIAIRYWLSLAWCRAWLG